MQIRHGFLCAAAAACCLTALAGDEAKAAPKAKKATADVICPAEAIRWEAGPAPGTRLAKLWGDMSKGGPFGVFISFDAGVMHPLHWHTRTLKLVVLSGTFLHTPEGGKEARLGPGSYLLQGGGNRHVSGASAEAPCTFFMTGDGAFDMKMAGGK